MSAATGVLVAVTFVWLGMVLALSFLEAPLKFRAPGVTLRIGLGIGRLVFRASHAVQALLAVVTLACLVVDPPALRVILAVAAAAAVLAAQLVIVQPRLARRSDAVLAGAGEVPRSRAHHAYVALEGIKVLALLAGGVLALPG